jgi:hypothetical protein
MEKKNRPSGKYQGTPQVSEAQIKELPPHEDLGHDCNTIPVSQVAPADN